MDLAVIWPLPDGSAGGGHGSGETAPREQRVVVECKLLWKGVDATIREGLPQTAAYMDTWNASEGHLVVFDRTPDKPWKDRIFRRDEEHDARRITVWGM